MEQQPTDEVKQIARANMNPPCRERNLTQENVFPKRQQQWADAEQRLAATFPSEEPSNLHDVEELRLALKLCSLFLRYPEEEWVNNKELEMAVDSIQNRGLQHCISQFISYTKGTPFRQLDENYVRWFDFSEQTSLYLTHGIFGDNRERGLAFVKLKMEFAKAGFYIKNGELPDYLPLILEFAAVAEEQFIQKMFLIHKKAIDTLLAELEKKDNPYAYLLKAVVTIAAIFLPTKGENEQHHAG